MKTLLVFLLTLICTNVLGFNFQAKGLATRPNGFILTANVEDNTTCTLLAVDDQGTTITGINRASGQDTKIKCRITNPGQYDLYLKITDGVTVQIHSLGKHDTLGALADICPDPELRTLFFQALLDEGVTKGTIRKAAMTALAAVQDDKYQVDVERTRIERKKLLEQSEERYVINPAEVRTEPVMPIVQ